MSDANNALLFVELVQCGSLSAAARKLGISRATASKRLGALEARLGVQLVRRTTRNLSLTEPGEAFLSHAVQAQNALQAAEDAAMDAANAPRGLLRVAVPILNADRVLAPLLVAFNEAYEHIDMEFVLGVDIRELIAQGFDVGLQAGLEANSELVMRRLIVDDMVLVASPSYIAQRGCPRSLDEMDSHACLMVKTPEGRVMPWPTLSGGSFTPRSIRLLSNSRDLTIVSARAGLGLAMAPRSLCRQDFDEARLVPVMEDVFGYKEWYSLVYSNTRIVPPKVRMFIDFALDYSTKLYARGVTF